MSTKANDQSGRVVDAGPAGFVIRFPYSADLVELVKTIEGRRYDPATKSWTVPLGRSAEVANLMSRHSFVATEAARKGLSNPTALRPVVAGAAGVTRVDDTFFIKFPYDKAKVEAVLVLFWWTDRTRDRAELTRRGLSFRHSELTPYSKRLRKTYSRCH